MCNDKTKGINVVDLSVRPMRWESANQIARRFGLAVGKVLDDMSSELVAYLKEISDTKEINVFGEPEKIKAYSELEIQLLMSQLTNLGISPAQILGLFRIFEKYTRNLKKYLIGFILKFGKTVTMKPTTTWNGLQSCKTPQHF